MTSDSRYIPSQHWYVPKSAERSPIGQRPLDRSTVGQSPVDRSTVGQKKINELQRQIVSMENDMKDRSALMHKLNRLQVIEDEKKEVEEKVLERNSSRGNTPRLLRSEMERLYGRESHLERNNSPGLDKNVIETVIQHRTKEFSQKQQEAALKAKYLDKERQRLVEARRRVEEQRRALLNTMSPTGKPQFSFHNDKLYMPYQPYHFFENREERIRNSFTLPITKEFPKIDKWKFKIRFVPMPIEDSELWNKYEKRIVEERQPEVDEAVRAFQSFTENKKPSHRHGSVRYFPQFNPEGASHQYPKYRSQTYDPYKEFFWRNKIKHLTFARSFDDFRDSLKFVAMHDGYRKHKEVARLSKRHQEFDTVQPKGDRYVDGFRRNKSERFPRKLKVKFRPKASTGEPYNFRNKNLYRTY